MSVYLNELSTHPFWVVCFMVFLWRIIISFRYLESGREMVILLTAFFFLMATTPVFLGVPFTEVKDKTIYGITNLFVFPILSIWALCFGRRLLKGRNVPVLMEIIWYMIFAIPGLLAFIEGFQKLFL